MQKKPQLKWRPEASSDLLNIVGYIADSNPTAADELAALIEEKVTELVNHPKLYKASTRVQGVREMVVHENYIVVYSENPNVIEIVSVLHARQQFPPI
jgi:toxin ParE1/3/4